MSIPAKDVEGSHTQMDRRFLRAAWRLRWHAFNCGIIGHVERACQKQKKGTTMSMAKEKSRVLTTKKKAHRRSKQMACQYGQRERRGKANTAQPKAMITSCGMEAYSEGRTPDTPPSLTIEMTLILESLVKLPGNPTPHQIACRGSRNTKTRCGD